MEMEFSFSGQKVAVNIPSWSVLESRVAEKLSQNSGFALATINLDHLVKLRRSRSYRAVYAEQDFITADGNPIVWMSHLAGRPVSLIPGSDAILPLARIAAGQGVSVALVGSSDDVLQAARRYMEQQVAGLKIAYTRSPPMGFDPQGDDARTILTEVAASGARLCFVALGAPKQECFAALGRRIAPSVGFASIGAGLDFFAGAQKRAPDWARRHALEWVWRMLTNPRRLAPRYVQCAAILPGQTLRALLLRLRRR